MFKKHKELILLILVFIAFIAIRSLHFSYYLNWSQDQADCAIEALKIFQTKKLTLIGPQISATLDGRLIFQGPATYYFFLFFLFLGGWDPVKASYLFMLFTGFMIFILFQGVKQLANKKTAWLAVLIYSFLPYYINYTRFLWNSTLQLTLTPVLILLYTRYKKHQTWLSLLLFSFWLGLLLQFHYQFVLVIFAIFIYLAFVKKINLKDIFLFLAGIVIGVSPLIIFELKHQFYNLNTMFLFLKNWQQVDKPGNASMPHYYLTLSFVGLTVILLLAKKIIQKINMKYIFIFGILLFLFGLMINLKKPNQSYWAPGPNWNYPMEKKAYDIIRSTVIKTDFNVADFSYYNTTATVVKYFLKRDGYQINYDDYYHNRFLFVISKGREYEKALSYEIAFFKPRKLLNQWSLDNHYDLFLFEKL